VVRWCLDWDSTVFGVVCWGSSPVRVRIGHLLTQTPKEPGLPADRHALPSGSYLTIAHPASDVDRYVGPALRQLNTRMGGIRAVPRSHEQVSRFFDGLEMVEPGLARLHRWRPGAGLDDTGREPAAHGAVARKP
jgi:hypothetical protein